MRHIFWTGYSNEERHLVINRIKDLVAQFGDVVDIHLFSDISINFTIEIAEFKIDKLYDELTGITGIEGHEYLNSISKQERIIYLNITFAKGTGNLIIEVPSVPG